MKRKISRHSITSKLVLLLIVLILPFNLASLFTAWQSVQNAYDQTEMIMESLNKTTLQQLDDRISATNNFIYIMETELDEFETFAGGPDGDAAYYLAETALGLYLSRNASTGAVADGFFWYVPDTEDSFVAVGEVSGNNTMAAREQKETLRAWIKENITKGYGRWSIAEIGEKQWLVRVRTTGDIYYGALFSLENIEENLRENASISQMEVTFAPSGQAWETSQKVISVRFYADNADLQMILAVPRTVGYEQLTGIQIGSSITILLYIFLIPILVLNMHRMVVRPLRRIENAMVRLKNGEQDYRIEQKRSSDEFETIDQTFNDMADHIQTLKIENYEKELQRQKMELRNLQLQIRPHFLMNMFNLLYSSAQVTDYHSIQKLALYLSEYFRYIFQEGKELQPFGRELELIRKYLEISSMRYPDWYEFICDVEEEALEVEVPPLLIHNFVENIFKHVVSFEKKVHIQLEAYTNEKEAVFVIADDGQGMPQEMADDMNAGIFPHENDGRVHVGIANSYRRIHYFYGDEGKLLVESAPGEGTCFTIVIPLGNKES